VAVTWRCLITLARTGLVVDEIKLAAAPSWETEIGQKGSWGVACVLGDVNPKDTVLDYMTSEKYSWIVVYKDQPIQGGMPADGGFSQKTRTLSVSGPGILGVFDDRIVRAVGGTPATIAASANNYTLTGVTRRRVIRELVTRSLIDTASGAGLPFDLTDGETETGSENRSFVASDFNPVLRKMQEESDDTNGPEFIIRPFSVLQSGQLFIGWKLAIGTPLLGNASLNAAWELGAAFGNVDVDWNMSIPIPHRVWTKGSGDGTITPVGYADNSPALQAVNVVYRDYVDSSHADVADKTKLDGFSAATLADRAAARSTWTATVRIDGKNKDGLQISPELGSWVEGDAPLFRMTKHPVIPDGEYRRRIVGMSSGNEPGTVALKIQPT
jgi:hypothetical protein